MAMLFQSVFPRGCEVLAAEGSQDNSGLYLNYKRELFGEREEIHNCSILQRKSH